MTATAGYAATKSTSPFYLYRDWVLQASGLSFEQAKPFGLRIAAAYDMGEPVWMIADELKLRAQAPRKHKTPRQLAVRVVAV